MRIVMWSGPRNLSTAMMYSFAARGDCAVWDEPFYAPYLKITGLAHPMADQIIAAHENNADKVAAAITGPIPDGKPHFYMKHMPHHMLDGVPMGWAKDCVHIHLIRHPARVIASYAAKREDPTLEDIGFAQQQSLYRRIGGIVVNSHDIRAQPEAMLRKLCVEIGLPFRESMLHWTAGGLPEDGVWASHWYGAVHKSTGFAGAEGALPDLKGAYGDLCAAALPAYQALRAKALMPD
jgi:sulfotransferase family protein